MKTKWPPKDEIENLRWTNNHTQYHSITFGFCRAQDFCEHCDYKIRAICRAMDWMNGIRFRIIKRHYGIKKGW